jgi:hypothetical protein
MVVVIAAKIEGLEGHFKCGIYYRSGGLDDTTG